jgi:hypothetical protein
MPFTIHDTRMTGCPTLAEVATPEGAWTIADALGIPRESALVLPVMEYPSHRSTRTAIDAVERRESAERVEAIGLRFAGFDPETVASAVARAA